MTTCRGGLVSPSIRSKSRSATVLPMRCDVLPDDGQRRVEQVGQREVVEADESDVAPQAALGQGANCPCRRGCSAR